MHSSPPTLSSLGLLHCFVLFGHCCIRQYQGCDLAPFFCTNMAMRGLVSSLRLPLVQQHMPVAGPLVAALAGQQHRQIHAGRLTNPWEEVRANPRLPQAASEGYCCVGALADAGPAGPPNGLHKHLQRMQMTSSSLSLLSVSSHHAAVSCRCCVWLSQTQRSSMRSSTH